MAGAATYEFVARSGERVLAERGSIEVPENRLDPNSRTLTLHYVRFPSTSRTPGSPIVYLAGGPGTSGIWTAARERFPLFMALREVADVIALDQRGTGESNAIPPCETDYVPPLDEPLNPRTWTAALTVAAGECLSFWDGAGVDVRGYNTLESARDLEALRLHLGARRISLWGISYGTHLALAALKIMGDNIDRLVLASPEGLDQTVKMPAYSEGYLSRLQSAIDIDPAARSNYPDVRGMMARVLARLERDPVNVTVQNAAGEPVAFVLGAWEVRLLTAIGMSDPEDAAHILALYRAADAGDYSGFAAIDFAQLRGHSQTIAGMRELMDIASGVSESDVAIVEQQAATAIFGDVMNFPMPHLRHAFGDLDLGDEFRQNPHSDRPTLVLSGTLDGRTFPEEQREAVRGLSNVTFVTVENAGHNLFMVDPRVTETITAFLQGSPIRETRIVSPRPHFQ